MDFYSACEVPSTEDRVTEELTKHGYNVFNRNAEWKHVLLYSIN